MRRDLRPHCLHCGHEMKRFRVSVSRFCSRPCAAAYADASTETLFWCLTHRAWEATPTEGCQKPGRNGPSRPAYPPQKIGLDKAQARL